MAERIAIFPGSFNPFTIGHKSVVDRALPLFDRLIIAIGVNAEKADAAAEQTRKLVYSIRDLYAGDPRVEVCAYHGLTTELARERGARWILRAVRTVKDFEYEAQLADINRRLTGIETLLLFSLPEHASISSSVVRELASYGVDTSPFIPQINQ